MVEVEVVVEMNVVVEVIFWMGPPWGKADTEVTARAERAAVRNEVRIVGRKATSTAGMSSNASVDKR